MGCVLTAAPGALECAGREQRRKGRFRAADLWLSKSCLSAAYLLLAEQTGAALCGYVKGVTLDLYQHVHFFIGQVRRFITRTSPTTASGCRATIEN